MTEHFSKQDNYSYGKELAVRRDFLEQTQAVPVPSKTENHRLYYSYEEELTARRDFLEQTQAVPVPPELYALWLYIYKKGGGGKVTHHRDYSFPTPRVNLGKGKEVIPLEPTAPNTPTPASRNIEYFDQNVIWMPTASYPINSIRIPTGHGATALRILHAPQLVSSVDETPTSNDKRKSWEYGHTTLLKLWIDEEGRAHASTNNPLIVESWPEIDEIIRDEIALKGILAAAVKRNQSLASTVSQNHLPENPETQ